MQRSGSSQNATSTISDSSCLVCVDCRMFNHVFIRTELMNRLCESAEKICSRTDKNGTETAGAFASTILTNMIIIKVFNIQLHILINY